MSQNSTSMVDGVIWKKITFFAVPLFLGNLFQQMYNTADSIIVGNLLGSNSLAAVSSSASLIFMMIGFFGGIFVGAGVVIARYFGASDEENMHIAIHTTVAVGLVSGVILTILGVWLSPQILLWMGTPENVMTESVEYLRIYFWGSLAFIMYNVFVGILQAIGDSKRPLYYLIISSIINIVLDIIFIAYLNLGVGGAALATIISQFVSAILCFIRLVTTPENYKLVIKDICFNKSMIKKIISQGLPTGMQNSIIAFTNVVVQTNINSFGEMAMAGVGAYSKIEGFGFLPITSFTMALTTYVSQNIGAKEFERAKKGARFGVLTTIILSEVIGIVVFVFAPTLISLFDTNPEVIMFGVEKSRVSGLFFFLLAYTHTIGAVLRGVGKSMIPMMVMLICWCVIRVIFLTITVPLTNSIQMVYWVYPITWLLSSLYFYIFMKKNHIFE